MTETNETFEDLVAKRIGPVGQVTLALQCGCGWMVTCTARHGESHHDLSDRVDRLLTDHLALEETDKCRPWIHA